MLFCRSTSRCDRIERQRLAEPSNPMGLRLMMITLKLPSELRKARWSGVGSSAVDAGLKPWNEILWKCLSEKW